MIVIGIAVPSFAYRFSSSSDITLRSKFQKSLKWVDMGCGGSQLDRKQTLPPHIHQADRQYNVRFAAEVFQFEFEPTPVSETRNHSRLFCLAQKAPTTV